MSRWREIVSNSLLIISALLAAAALVAQVDLGSKPDPMGIGYYVVMPGIGLISLGAGAVCLLFTILLVPEARKYGAGVLLLSGLPLIFWPALIYRNAIQMAQVQREEEKMRIVRELMNGQKDVAVFQAPTNAAWYPVQMSLTNEIRK